jgi:exodeoxyribonuclease VIII
MSDYMIDIETFATSERAAIRAIAVVEFCRLGDGGGRHLVLDTRPSMDGQIMSGREIDPNTVVWWGKTEPLVIKHDAIGVESCDFLDTALLRLVQFIRPSEEECRIWSRGAFDLSILRHAWRDEFVAHPPWRYWQERDVRTLDEFAPKEASAIPHHPLYDCFAQISQVQHAFRLLTPTETA